MRVNRKSYQKAIFRVQPKRGINCLSRLWHNDLLTQSS